jgi:hypothetical protein
MPSLFKLFAVSAVVMGMAHTLTRERIFLWLREALGGKETFFGYLASCPYCASHYLAFALVPLTSTYGVTVAYDWGWGSKLLTWFLSSILITVIAAFLRVIFYFVDETQGLVRRRQKVEDHKLAVRETLLENGEGPLPPPPH